MSFRNALFVILALVLILVITLKSTNRHDHVVRYDCRTAEFLDRTPDDVKEACRKLRESRKK
jgi:hypothetical protein